VSVITPTWQRHEKLVNRCIPSVQAQAYPKVEHIIVSDGPDPELTSTMIELGSGSSFTHPVYYCQLPEATDGRQWGSRARLAGIERASGDFIAYCDDDDALRPEHVPKLVAAITPDCSWAYSRMASYSSSGPWTEIGGPVPAMGQIGTPMIMHRRSLLEHGTWGPASSIEDWLLVKSWLDAGQAYRFVDEVTVDVWPSVHWG
jgi:glycosyltransferase involved in cell wall biosynthesis